MADEHTEQRAHRSREGTDETTDRFAEPLHDFSGKS
jgi:hypothetical protein